MFFSSQKLQHDSHTLSQPPKDLQLELEVRLNLVQFSRVSFIHRCFQIRIEQLEQEVEVKERFIRTYSETVQEKDQQIEKLLDDIQKVRRIVTQEKLFACLFSRAGWSQQWFGSQHTPRGTSPTWTTARSGAEREELDSEWSWTIHQRVASDYSRSRTRSPSTQWEVTTHRRTIRCKTTLAPFLSRTSLSLCFSRFDNANWTTLNVNERFPESIWTLPRKRTKSVQGDRSFTDVVFSSRLT